MALLIILAAASWGLGSVLAQRVAMPQDPLLATGWQLLCGGMVAVLAGLIAGEAGPVDVATFSATSIAAFAYVVVVGSIVAGRRLGRRHRAPRGAREGDARVARRTPGRL
jgi:drug/metabolite transporter (DMT)-like permease